MKLMTGDQIIELVAPSEQSEAVAVANLKVLADTLGDTVESMQDGVKKGFLKQTEILADGRPVYMLWWHLTDQGNVHFNCGVSLDMANDNFPVLIKAFEKIAANVDAKAIEFHTKRRGLLLKVKGFGYQSENVHVVKVLKK
jgi:hypothetical protein